MRFFRFFLKIDVDGELTVVTGKEFLRPKVPGIGQISDKE